MTTYQKLKQEVSDLKKELDVVINEPDSFAASSIKMKWMLNRRLENAVMAGEPISSMTFDSSPVKFDDEHPDYIKSSQEEI